MKYSLDLNKLSLVERSMINDQVSLTALKNLINDITINPNNLKEGSLAFETLSNLGLLVETKNKPIQLNS